MWCMLSGSRGPPPVKITKLRGLWHLAVGTGTTADPGLNCHCLLTAVRGGGAGTKAGNLEMVGSETNP